MIDYRTVAATISAAVDALREDSTAEAIYLICSVAVDDLSAFVTFGMISTVLGDVWETTRPGEPLDLAAEVRLPEAVAHIASLRVALLTCTAMMTAIVNGDDGGAATVWHGLSAAEKVEAVVNALQILALHTQP